MELTLTAVWIREKFEKAKIEQRLVNDEFGNRPVTVNTDGDLSIAHYIWMCDPEQYIIGQNTIRFSGVYQVIFMHARSNIVMLKAHY